MGVVGVLALLANAGVALMLYRYRSGDANMRSVWICSRNDAIGNVAVILAAAGVFGTGTGWPDLIVAAIMAVLGISGGWQIVRQATGRVTPCAGRVPTDGVRSPQGSASLSSSCAGTEQTLRHHGVHRTLCLPGAQSFDREHLRCRGSGRTFRDLVDRERPLLLPEHARMAHRHAGQPRARYPISGPSRAARAQQLIGVLTGADAINSIADQPRPQTRSNCWAGNLRLNISTCSPTAEMLALVIMLIIRSSIRLARTRSLMAQRSRLERGCRRSQTAKC